MSRPAASQPVLVITDDAAVRELVNQAFSLAGHRVVYAASDIDMVETTAREQPRLLVVELAGTPSVAAIQALRQRGSDVPILVLTARDQEEVILAALEAGADDYLVKPFDTTELRARLAAVLRRRHLP